MTTLNLVGWRKGIQTVSLIRAIKEHSTIQSLAQAKRLIEELLDGKVITLEFPAEAEREEFRRLAEQLGAQTE